jgi:hypothetical protein
LEWNTVRRSTQRGTELTQGGYKRGIIPSAAFVADIEIDGDRGRAPKRSRKTADDNELNLVRK